MPIPKPTVEKCTLSPFLQLILLPTAFYVLAILLSFSITSCTPSPQGFFADQNAVLLLLYKQLPSSNPVSLSKPFLTTSSKQHPFLPTLLLSIPTNMVHFLPRALDFIPGFLDLIIDLPYKIIKLYENGPFLFWSHLGIHYILKANKHTMVSGLNGRYLCVFVESMNHTAYMTLDKSIKSFGLQFYLLYLKS